MGVSLKRMKVMTTLLVARIPSMAIEVGTRAQGEFHSSLMIGVGRQVVLLGAGRMSDGQVSQVNSSSWYWYPSQSCRQVTERDRQVRETGQRETDKSERKVRERDSSTGQILEQYYLCV